HRILKLLMTPLSTLRSLAGSGVFIPMVFGTASEKLSIVPLDVRNAACRSHWTRITTVNMMGRFQSACFDYEACRWCAARPSSHHECPIGIMRELAKVCLERPRCVLRVIVMTNADPVLTAKEVAEDLRCSKSQVYRLMSGEVEGVTKLPHLALGRKKVVLR